MELEALKRDKEETEELISSMVKDLMDKYGVTIAGVEVRLTKTCVNPTINYVGVDTHIDIRGVLKIK